MATLITFPSPVREMPDEPDRPHVRIPPPPPEWLPLHDALKATGIIDLVGVEQTEGGVILRMKWRPGVGDDERRACNLFGVVAGVLAGVLAGVASEVELTQQLIGGDDAHAVVRWG